jgi:hypothetical protein
MMVLTTFLLRKIIILLVSSNFFFWSKNQYLAQVQNHIMDHTSCPIYLLVPLDHYLLTSPTNDQSLLLIPYLYKYLLCIHNFQYLLICFPFLHQYASKLVDLRILWYHHQENHTLIVLIIELHHFLFHFDLLLFELMVIHRLPKSKQ